MNMWAIYRLFGTIVIYMLPSNLI
uniref:Uncharacterized protein n=1 Tax=Arundo donax TaxID=35708 RepID=A0A0A9HJV0_ARUDO